MKPVLLEMTAFGSYVQPTTVDFRKLKHSLFLITGDTGAGKTTIFDGIMIALYGVASGAGTTAGRGESRARTFDMMHCDHVDKSVDTKVSLVFEHMGKTHRVERTLHFKRKRGSGEYEKTTPQAKFWEQDKDVLEQTGPVTKRITQLLGLNAEQFRKIAMLAQGEFRKFLDANSEDKNDILGELFDNSAYVYFQELFAAARKKLQQERNDKGIERMRRAMDDFLCPDEDGAFYSVSDPQLEDRLWELVNQDGRKREELKKKEQALREEEKGLHEKKGRAREQNRLLEELSEKEAEWVMLLRKKADMEELNEQAVSADKAFYKVKPIMEVAEKAKRDYDSTVVSIGKTRERLGRLEEDRKVREEEWQRCEQSKKPEIDRLVAAISDMEKSLPLYGKLKETLRKMEEEQKLAGKAGEQRKTAEEKKNQIAGELAALNGMIRELEDADAKKERLFGTFRRAGEDLERLTAKEGILAQVRNVCEKERELKKEQNALREIIGQVKEFDLSYHRLYQMFLDGQAGILASKLEQELAEKGEAACPVCGTAFCSSHAGHFAKMAEDVPEKGKVDEARFLLDQKEQDRQKQEQIITGLETSVRVQKAGIISRLLELDSDLDGVDWETVCADGWLNELEARYRKRKEQAETAYSEAASQSRRLHDLKDQTKGKEEEARTCDEELEKSTKSEWEHTQACERQKAVAAEQIKALDHYEECPDEESAGKQKRAWEDDRQRHQQEIEQAAERYHRADRLCEEAKGALQTNLEALPKLEAEMFATAERLQEVLAEHGFSNPGEVMEALRLMGNGDAEIEKRLLETKEAVADFTNKLQNIERNIAELNDKTKGMQKTDLQELDRQIAGQGEALLKIQEKLELCTRQYDNHKKTADTVREANRFLKDTKEAWERLCSLADLANGANAAGGKLSFDRYVMGYVFREILEMANRRLDIMSGGRYELRHEMQAGRDNATAGLDVSVFDMTTGKCRPAQSLSGGESFFVSLSLALGLSDVVLNHAGGKQLDTLFIDEGFGYLDNDVLDRALAVLSQLTEGNRLVGIISHVARLEESIPQQIRVKNSGNGSTLTIVG